MEKNNLSFKSQIEPSEVGLTEDASVTWAIHGHGCVSFFERISLYNNRLVFSLQFPTLAKNSYLTDPQKSVCNRIAECLNDVRLESFDIMNMIRRSNDEY